MKYAERDFFYRDPVGYFYRHVERLPDLPGCWLWSGLCDDYGYGIVTTGGVHVRAHVISHGLFIGPVPDGLQVLHKCDTPPCARPDHLYAGTQGQNMRDAVARGRHVSPLKTNPNLAARGEDSGLTTLVNADVLEIRRLGRAGFTQRKIALAFGISPAGVGMILRRRNWRHLP